MIIRKLRLQRGWSQDKLAQISGLSVRTIQRIERGQQPGLESLQSLAAAFDVNISELKLENKMNDEQHETQKEKLTNSRQEEANAMEYVRDIKGFYSHLIKYIVVISLLFIINVSTNSDYLWAVWPMLGWGVGVISHGLNVFEVFNFFGPKWEKERVERRLGRKL
mgnify:CR=1 FL=1|jgi:transcriptional regulator with XRE-family HTH domain